MESVFQIGLALTRGETLLAIGSILLIYAFVGYIFSLKLKRADIADVLWGPAFALISVASLLLSQACFFKVLLAIAVTAWATRLSCRIFLRMKRKKEDFRYLEMKKSWGKRFNLRLFFQVFILQAMIAFVIGLPLIWIQTENNFSPNNYCYFFLFVFLAGAFLEGIADWQLDLFCKESANHKKVCTKGVWGFSRHPNYLAEIIMWSSIWAISAFISGGIFLVISPFLLTYLLVFVSGAAPLEKKMKEYIGYSEYQKKVPLLCPFSFVLSLLYLFFWYVLVGYGWQLQGVLVLALPLCFYLIEAFSIYFFDYRNFTLFIPLSIYAFALGSLLETAFVFFDILNYTNTSFTAPFVVLALYPLFSSMLNSSLKFLNKNLALTFFLGGVGAIFSYMSGQSLLAVKIPSLFSYVAIFFGWGVFLSSLVILNRKLLCIREYYTNEKRLKEPFTIIFDLKCPICNLEKKLCTKRVATGSLLLPNISTQKELEKTLQVSFSYDDAMEKIHGINLAGEVFKGTKVLSELYARTNLLSLAILLQAPFFRSIFNLLYFIWAKLRFLFRSA
jgi:steroid 5-alpha reductase family enzyme/predicted DCC family thiol-disulfide oxidoreductase YuxK